MDLGVSAELTGNYLSVQIEYGDTDTKYPELVDKINMVLKNDQDTSLREWVLDCATFENSDGVYRSGTVISPEESPSYILVSAQVHKNGGGVEMVQAQAQVFQKRNQALANHF